ncbi:MAG: hypothetical protein JWR80_8830 [Bradyrhizobium sp.]|nr:hypothetical protein [Bradyrhizobium sp.]
MRISVDTELGFDEVLDGLRRAMGQTSFPELVALAQAPIGQAAFEQQVQERFVGESGFMLFAELDHGGWLSKFDIERRVVRWILGNPLIAITMMRHDITAGLFAPVEVLIAENADRKGATLTYVRPSSLIVTSDNPPLKEAGQKLDAKLDALIIRVTERRS